MHGIAPFTLSDVCAFYKLMILRRSHRSVYKTLYIANSPD